MSISVQVYRARVGSFHSQYLQYSRSKVSSNKLRTKISMNKHSKMLVSLKVVFLMICIPMGYTLTAEAKESNQILTAIGPTNFSTSIQYEVDYNFLAKYTFGNRKQSGLKICHWNAGSSHLVNKLNEIESVISNYKPHIFGISEASFRNSQSKEDVKIDGYDICFASTLDNPNLNMSRLSVFIHKDLQFKLRKDLMSNKFSSIWLEVGFKN